FSSIGKAKHTSDDSSRHHLVGPAINQLVCTGPPSSYNRPNQLKLAYNHFLMRVLTQSVDYK
ncbi:unnamed protein product, partial [Hymenolepis diminuta]